MRNETKIILILLIVCSIFYFAFPLNSMKYGDEHKGTDGVFYLASYDSSHFLGKAYHGIPDDTLSWLAYIIITLTHSTFLIYWLPPVFGLINIVLFYFIIKRYVTPSMAGLGTLIYGLHPFVFYTIAKGYYDTNFLISFFVLLILLLALSKKYVYILLLIAVAWYTWEGWVLILLYVLIMAFVALLIKKQYWAFLLPFGLVPFHAKFSNYASSYFNRYPENLFISELNSYRFQVPTDIMLYLVSMIFVTWFIIKVILDYGKKEIDNKMPPIIIGFIIFSLAALKWARFQYLSVIFIVIIFMICVQWLMQRFSLKYIWLVFLVLGVYMVHFDYNADTIVMEDAIANAALGSTHCIASAWDDGNMYEAYGNVRVLYRGSSTYIKTFTKGIFSNENITREVFSDCTILITSRIRKILDAFLRFSDVNLTNESFITAKYLNNYNTKEYIGRDINITAYYTKG